MWSICNWVFVLTQKLIYWWVFYFEAEDGIRDRNVTGVQTCALPIFSDVAVVVPGIERGEHHVPRAERDVLPADTGEITRSEERRVGEGRTCRRLAFH